MVRIRTRDVLGLALAALAIIGTIPPLRSAQPSCTPTRPDAEGPFYKPNASERASTGRGLVITGTVRSVSGCAPLAAAQIEWWSANPSGQYDDDHRAKQLTDSEGRYRYETDLPGRYPGRQLHLHARVTATSHRSLITQLYPKAGQNSLAFDFVLTK